MENSYKFIIDYFIKSAVFIFIATIFFSITYCLYINSKILCCIFLIIFTGFTTFFYDKLQLIGIKTLLPENDATLNSILLNIAQSSQVNIKNIFVLQVKNNNVNAGIYGYGKNKNIILWQSLITNDKFSKDNIKAIFAHELYHCKNNDNVKHVILLIICNITVILAFMFFVNYIFTTPYIIINLFYFILYFLPLFLIIFIISNFISRQIEYQADRYAATLVGKELVVSTLNKIKINNSLVNQHPIYAFFHNTHPVIQNRIMKLTCYNIDD
jgi:STE24 endopeptidase